MGWRARAGIVALGLGWSSAALAGEPTAAPEPTESAPPPVEPSGPFRREVADFAISEARIRKLAERTEWLRLGHWRGKPDAWKSEVDGPQFFLASNGKHDPAAELEATLRQALDDRDPTDPKLTHAVCRFPARLAWLTRELSLDPASFPTKRCEKFDEYWRLLEPSSIALVFSSYYLNNPASAFGHTFLRFERESSGGQSELLDNGVDFAANVDTGNALVYAFKGLTGRFPGVFHRLPFFYKVREYNDFESRDLWEYKLALPPEQVRFVAAHLWELGGTYFDYWYLDENCSYHVLGLLEVASPDLHLVDRTRFPVLPADTVRIVAQHPGLVRSVQRRPSQRTVLRRRLETLDGDERARVAELADDPEADLGGISEERRVRVLDAALDLVDVRFARELILEQPGPGHARKQRLLERRAAILVPSDDPDTTPEPSARPDRGHGAARAGVGSGVNSLSGGFAEIEGRLALHDLADDPAGYSPNAQIEFLPVRARLSLSQAKPSLEDAFLVRIASLTPFDRFDQQTSWKIRFGATTLRDRGCSGCLAAAIDGGGGLAFDLGRWATLLATGDVGFYAGPGLTDGQGTPFRLALGPSGGLKVRLGGHVTSLLTGGWSWIPFGRVNATHDASLTIRWAPIGRVALDLRARLQPLANEIGVQSLVYF